MFKKKTTVPTLADRTAEAHALSANALNVFSSAANDLEVSAQLKQEIAHELFVQSDELRRGADEIEDQGIELEAAASDDQNAADRIRSLFA